MQFLRQNETQPTNTLPHYYLQRLVPLAKMTEVSPTLITLSMIPKLIRKLQPKWLQIQAPSHNHVRYIIIINREGKTRQGEV